MTEPAGRGEPRGRRPCAGRASGACARGGSPVSSAAATALGGVAAAVGDRHRDRCHNASAHRRAGWGGSAPIPTRRRCQTREGGRHGTGGRTIAATTGGGHREDVCIGRYCRHCREALVLATDVDQSYTCPDVATRNRPSISGNTGVSLNIFPWTSVQGTIHTRTLKNKLPFPVHVAGVLDQNRSGRAFLRPTLSGDVPSLSLDYGKKRIGPPDHRTRLLEVATSSSSVRSAGADRG